MIAVKRFDFSSSRSALRIALLALPLSACNMLEARLEAPPPPLPEVPQPEAARDGAIAAAGNNISLFEDTKAHNVGDLLTITLVERTAAQKSATTSTSKTDDVSLGDVKIYGRSFGTNSGVTSDRSFDGKGSSAQSNSLTGSITVAVVQRYANGNLRVSGEKQVRINQGSEYVRLEGVVRPADITTDNVVTSDRVANARVSYTGHGQLADANAQGWLTRFFNSPWSPF